MIITKELDAEIKQFLDNYWNRYLEGDLQTWSTYLADDYKNIGGTQEEIWNSKKEILDYTKAIMDQMVGATELRNKQTQVFSLTPYILAHEFTDIYIKIENDWVFYGKFRLSSILKRSGTGWLVVHQHGSYPDSKTEEGEAFAFNKISTENRDLKDAISRRTVELENKTRELEIEAALERVRAVAMGMNKPDDMLDICRIISRQLELLNVKDIRNVQTAIFYESKNTYLNYEYYVRHDKLLTTEVNYQSHKILKKFANQMLKGAGELFTESIKGKELKDWYAYQKTTNQFIDTNLEKASSLNFYFYSLGPVVLGMSTYTPLNEAEIKLFKRFRNVFELSYRRFKDIEKAQAQSREAQVELALERVRARTMGMQKSEELKEVIQVIFEQFVHLNIHIEHTGFIMDYKARDDMYIWIADQLGVPSQVTIPYFNSVVWNRFNEAKEKGMDFLAINLTFDEKNGFYQQLLKYIPEVPEEAKEFLFNCPGLAISMVFLENVCLYIENFSGISYSDEENDTLMRFGNVFQQTYTRFYDLKKAEAQTREAQIEASLERVRSKAMSMQRSEDLGNAVAIVFEELDKLNMGLLRCGIAILNSEKRSADVWTTTISDDNTVVQVSGDESMDIHPLLQSAFQAWQNQVDHSYILKGDDLNNYYKALIDVNFRLPDSQSLVGGTEGTTQYYYNAIFTSGGLFAFRETEFPAEAKTIMKRFADVFDFTYTRFNDLKQAEAQAKEAKIEVALERVRSRTLAMHKSDELGDVATILFKEMNKLVENLWTCGFVLCERERTEDEWWLSTETGFVPAFYLPNIGDATHANIYQGWLNGESYHTEQLEGEALKEHYEWLMNIPVSRKIFEEMKAGGFSLPTWQKLHCAYFSQGYLVIITQVPCPEELVFKRFAQVFDQTYTRFLDLQRVEAQTHKANIEVALERVRARALAMQQPEELVDVAEVMRHEMGLLGVEELETSSIYINKENTDDAECWYALKDIHVPDKKLVADHFDLNYRDTWVGRQMLDFYQIDKKEVSIIMQGDQRKEWVNYCAKQSPVFKGYYGEVIPDRTYHMCKFSNGSIGAATPGDISEESWELLRRAASVFSLAYSRFKDLTKARTDLQQLKEEKQRAETALTELKTTQTQLIQSEKMASLGELTAGIAHEIQNPLNFVNNFSEVNKELLEELNKEINSGNMEEVKEIAKNLIENEIKINHHGKRADSIVKGMLQHSRSSSGQKEPTDINALVDEFLRLAYHGLRAKDKSFNAILKTTYDEKIGNINIIPQDIGRVILNLITNAFYAVGEKKKKSGDDYEPTLVISTKKSNEKIEVWVEDNGNGIPAKVLDKIFQPFFTTKPTGEGTGLGLSLSYDIIKAHAGEITVETKVGDGSKFILKLPDSK